MKQLSFLFTILIGSMCVLQSCSKDDDEEEFTMSNESFVTQASSSNNLEVKAGQLALTNGQLDTVKKFAQHMVVEHTAAQAELSALASTKGLTATQGLLSHHQSNLNLLAQFNASVFDKRFAELMVVSHQEAVALFSQAAQPNGVPDPELRAWAAAKLPSLQKHLEESNNLYTRVNVGQ
jgi:putative membrane protein